MTSPSAGPVGDLPEQAREALIYRVKALLGAVEAGHEDAQATAVVDAVLSVAVPLIRAHIADQPTAEMLAVNTRYIGSEVAAAGYVDGLTVAARVARGGTDGS